MIGSHVKWKGQWNGLLGKWTDTRDYPVGPFVLTGLQGYYDTSDTSSLVYDSAGRVSLFMDKSGNSGVNCLCLNGVAGNYASAPDSAALDITGDIDLRVKASLVDWTPSVPVTLVGKYVGPGENRSYRLTVGTSGNAILQWTPLGTAASLITATSTAVIPVSNFEAKWIRGTLDVSNGSTLWEANFYTSDDGVTWTPLGTAVLGGAATSIFSGSGIIEIGSSQTGTNDLVTGIIYRAQVYNGIGGTLVFDANFTLAPKLASSFTESSANAATVTINTSGATGARISGERDLYQGTVANQPIYLPWSGENYGFTGPAVNGNGFTAPSTAGIVSTAAEFVFGGVANDWTPASLNEFVTKSGTDSSDFAYDFRCSSSGLLYLYWSQDGTTLKLATSTQAVSFTDKQMGWAKASLLTDNGAGGNTVNFYTSTDGQTWTQLGATVTVAGNGAVFNSTSRLHAGSAQAVINRQFDGRVVYASVANTISATPLTSNAAPIAIFDPSRYVSGPTFTASTGEVWTVNGGAQIVPRTGLYFDGSNDYLKSAAFALSQPETVCFVGGQVTWADLDQLFSGESAAMAAIQRTMTPALVIAAGAEVASNNGLALKTGALLSAVFNGAASTLRINRGTATTGDPGAGNAGGFTLGASRIATAPANIFVSEVAIYNTALSTASQDALALYEGRKWGFTV